MKLDYLTSTFEDIANTINSEKEKAIYWYNKKKGGHEKDNQILSSLLEDVRSKNLSFGSTTAETYKSKDGNQYIIFSVEYLMPSKIVSKHLDYVSYIFEENGDYGVVRTYQYGSDTPMYIIAYPPHVIKSWLKEAGFKDEGLSLIQSFLESDPVIAPYVNEDGTFVCAHEKGIFTGSISKGESPNHIKAIVDEFTPVLFLTTDETKRYKDAIVMYKNYRESFYTEPEEYSDKAKQLEEEDKLIEKIYGNGKADFLGGATPNNIKFARRIEILFDLYHDIRCSFPKCITNCDIGNMYSSLWYSVILSIDDDRRLHRDLMLAVQMMLKMSFPKYTLPDDEARRISLKVKGRLQEYKERICKILTESKQLIMEQKAKNDLCSLLKHNGLTSKVQKEIDKLRSKNDYFRTAETVYALSRLIPGVETEGTRTKIEKANKEWIEIVIDKGYSEQLKEYTDKYGKEIVKKAIWYLMDNYLWTSPVGSVALNVKQPSNYDGLKAIDEAVEYLKDNGMLEEKVVQEEKEVLQPDIDDTPISTNTTQKVGETKAIYDELIEAFKTAHSKLAMIGEIVMHDEISEELYKENKELSEKVDKLEKSENAWKDYYNKQVEHIKMLNDKKIAELEQSKELYKSNYEKERKAKEEALSQAYESRTAKEDFERKYKISSDNYSKLLSEYDALKKDNDKTLTLPKVKFIPQSKLLALPLVGQTMLNILKPFLKEYNVVIDERK